MFFFSISSKLCNVAFDINTPPKLTSSRRATGVIAPVRPTWKSIDLINVFAFSAENLRAIAHLGFFPTIPSLSCFDMSLILKTNPFISYRIVPLRFSISL